MAKKKTGLYKKTFVFEGKKYYAYGKTKKEATEAYWKKKQEVESGAYKKNSELSLDEYFERWEDARRGTIKESTLRKQHFEYQNISLCPIDKNGKTFGSMLVKDIETQNIRDLQRNLSEMKRIEKHPQCQDPDRALYKTTSINALIRLLSHILKDASFEKIIDSNPCTPVKDLKRREDEPKARDTHHRALTIKETDAFMECAAGTWYYNHYKFLLNSGLRCGELGALKLSDIDWKNEIIYVQRSVTRSETGSRVIGSTPKTDSSNRKIPLTQELRDAITGQLELNKIAFGEGMIISIKNGGSGTSKTFLQKKQEELSELIFKSSENSILSDTVINRDIRRKCRNAEIDRFSAHAFRDTFATRAIENGMNPQTLKEILGHTSYAMTMDLYCHVLDDTKRREMDLVQTVSKTGTGGE